MASEGSEHGVATRLETIADTFGVGLTRRDLLRTAGGVAAGLAAGPLLAACGGSSAGGASTTETLVAGTFGGTWGDSFAAAVAKPFEQQAGAKVIQDSAFTTWYNKIKLNPSNPPIDVGVFTDVDAARGRADGLWATLDTANIPNAANLGKFNTDSPVGFPYCWALLGLVVNTDRVKQMPTSIADFWKAPWKGMRVGLPGLPNTFGYDWLIKIAEVFGGGIDNVDPGFTALKQLNVQYAAADFVRAYDELCAGNLDLLFWVSDYTLTVQQKGCAARFVVPKEGGIIVVNELLVPKGTKHKALAEKMINYFLGVQAQNAFAAAQQIGAVNSQASPTFPGPLGPQAQQMYSAQSAAISSYYPGAKLLAGLPAVTQKFQSLFGTG